MTNSMRWAIDPEPVTMQTGYSAIPGNNKLSEYLSMWQSLGLNDPNPATWSNKKMGLEFAERMANAQMRNEPPPNFYGNNANLGSNFGSSQPQYQQPLSMSSGQNPYSKYVDNNMERYYKPQNALAAMIGGK